MARSKRTLSTLSGCVLLVACDRGPIVPPPPESLPPWNAAAVKLLGAVCAESGEGNVGLFVPALLPLLRQVAAGANGATRDEFATLLGPLDDRGDRLRLAALARLDDVEFASGFRAWLDDGLAVTPAFAERMRSWRPLDGVLARFDFRGGDPASVLRDANRFVSDLLERPTVAFEPGDVGRDTRLLLLSAARVHWEWEHEFPEHATHPAPFFRDVARKQSVDVSMMHLDDVDLRIAEVQGAPCVELPCKGGLRLDLVKCGADRRRRDELLARPELLAGLDAALAAVHPHERKLGLPRVRASSRHELRAALERLGAGTAFTPRADLTGIAGAPGELFVAGLRHGCFVEWDEEGGSAGGYTGGVLAAEYAGGPLLFDEPFLAFLRAPDGALLLAQWIELPTGAGS